MTQHATRITYHGTVVQGEQQGRIFGFPTANVQAEHNLLAGVYAGNINVDGKSYQSAIIINPTKKNIVEAYIIGYDGDLYGKETAVSVGQFIRGWMEFGSLEEGKEQIRKDLEVISQLKS